MRIRAHEANINDFQGNSSLENQGIIGHPFIALVELTTNTLLVSANLRIFSKIPHQHHPSAHRGELEYTSLLLSGPDSLPSRYPQIAHSIRTGYGHCDWETSLNCNSRSL